ncbi:MAG: hypothetical protein ACI8V2_000537 [Candidatus Latescibacterota bacterium]|jgi:hypothetical protein
MFQHKAVFQFVAFFTFVLSIGMAQAQVPTYTVSTLHTSDSAILGIKALAVDGAGNVYYYKVSERLIEKLSPNGTVTVFSGAGGSVIRNIIIGSVGPFAPADLALQMQDNNANLMADDAGNLYFHMNSLTMRYNPTDGQVTHIAGGGLLGAAFTERSEALKTNFNATSPPHLALDSTGNLYFTSVTSPPTNAPFIIKMDATGILTTVAGGSARGFEGDGGSAIAAQLEFSRGGDIAFDPLNNLFIGAYTRIRRVDSAGIITTVAGNGERGGDTGISFTNATALESGLDIVSHIAAGPDGSIFFINGRSNVHQITPDGKINTIGETTGNDNTTSLDVDKEGNVYVTAGTSVFKFTRATPFAGTPQALGGAASSGGNAGTGTGTGTDTGTGGTTTGGTDGGTTGSTTVLPTGTRGPIALDLDKTAGDQMVLQTTTAPKAGDSVVIDVIATAGALGQGGFEVTLTFDATQLSYKDFSPTDAFTGGLALNTAGNGTITISVALLGMTSSKDAGSIGQATFEVLSGFTGETNLTLSKAQFASGAVEIGPGGAFVVIGGATSFPTEPLARTDFSGDGEVGFSDFITFAGAFGKASTDSGYDARIDLNDDGSVNFPDFLLFAQLFGQKVPTSKPANKSIGQHLGINTEAVLTLVPQASNKTDQVTLSAKLNDFQMISAYNLILYYDASGLQLMRAETAHPSRFAQRSGLQPVVLQTLSEDGGLILSDVFANTIQNQGTLLNLTFQIIDPEAISGIEISNVLIADAKGNINAVHGARLADLNLVPSEFALRQNHPNPFNPETQIGYQLPEPGDVSLTIYSLLGQQIRQLVNAPQAAGIYQISWDGQDALGRSVASGLYFYHLKAGQFSQTKMMILLK